MMQPAPAPISCKICGGRAPLFGRADFHRSCLDGQRAILPPSGRPVSYWRCEDCGFLFTPDFDGWAPARFAAEIYNDQYVLVDPEYKGDRPRRMAAMLQGVFAAQRGQIRLLDYGGGDGLVAALLREAGFDAVSWDPFADGGAPPEGRFDVISCFEVMEHAPDPAAVVAEMAARLKPGGMVLFSTLLQPADIAAQGTGWWYLGPRNGHVSLFSEEALRRLWAGAGLGFSSFSEGMHSAGGAPA